MKTGCIGQFVKSSRRKWTDEKGMRIILYSKSYNKYIEEIGETVSQSEVRLSR